LGKGHTNNVTRNQRDPVKETDLLTITSKILEVRSSHLALDDFDLKFGSETARQERRDVHDGKLSYAHDV
jgi:hypothetical protein